MSESAQAVGMEDLQRKTDAARQRLATEKPASSTTSAPERAGDQVQTAERTCPAGHTYKVTLVLGRELGVCQTCFPLPAAAQTRAAVAGLRGDELLDALHAGGVNVHKYQDATLEAFDPENDPQALDAARKWLAEWDATRRQRYPRRPWAYFHGAGSEKDGGRVVLGKLGNGKTMLAVAMVRDLLERGALHPKRFRFVTLEALLLEAEATFRAQADDSELKMLRRYERPDLLVVDEVGVREQPSNHATRILDELTKRREGKATLWTGNVSVKVLQQMGEGMKRIASRIAGECGDGACYVVDFHGPDRRIARSRLGRRTIHEAAPAAPGGA